MFIGETVKAAGALKGGFAADGLGDQSVARRQLQIDDGLKPDRFIDHPIKRFAIDAGEPGLILIQLKPHLAQPCDRLVVGAAILGRQDDFLANLGHHGI